jgi:hypothetical protein
VYLTPDGSGLVSHGELAISRLTLGGEVVWVSYGADVFSEAIELTREFVIATDFEHRRYRFDLTTGAPL